MAICRKRTDGKFANSWEVVGDDGNRIATGTTEKHALRNAVNALAGCPKDDLENLVHYCDFIYTYLVEAGYEGKADALKTRYMRVANAIGYSGQESSAHNHKSD